MRPAPLVLPFLLTTALGCGTSRPPAPTPEATPAMPDTTPPTTRRGDTVDAYFGVQVADPYAWLEDLDSDETRAWITAQDAVTRPYLDALPHQEPFTERLTELWEHARWGTPVRKADKLFYAYNDGTMDQSVLMVQDGDDGEPRVLLDPNTLSDDGTVALAGWEVTDDGAHLAYGLAEAGSDWRTWKVRDVATAADGPDELNWVKFSGARWLPDGSGFFYSRFPAPETGDFEERLAFQQVWFHRRGTPQADDVLVHADADHPDWGFHAELTSEGERLFVHVSEGTEEKSRQYVYDVATLDLDAAGGTADGQMVKLLDDFDADYRLITEQDGTAWFQTDLDAPRGRIIAIDLATPARDAWREIVPQGEHTLAGSTRVGDRLVLTYLVDAYETLVVHELDGTRVGEVALPGIGSVGWVSGDEDSPLAHFGFTSFTRPNEIHRLDVSTMETALWKAPDVPFDPDLFETVQVRYTSKDGTEVPMFLTRRKDLDPEATHPTLLYGYGGFNISITPGFKAMNLVWLEAGGVYAVANLRGGGEYGRAWHMAGTKQSKQNVFDDFIAAGEWLVEQGWTTPDQLGIHGRSNGGLLAGATLLQRPDLFGAAIPSVGVMDMLKYHRWTIGWAWASDYGTSEESEEMFEYLRGYSPVHNAVDGTAYPPTLITTADHDDRVVPGHSYKFAAALQQANDGTHPVLIRVETRGGHGAGTPVSMLVQEDADKLSFLAWHLGLE